MRLLERSLTEVASIDDEWAAESLASLAEFSLALGQRERVRAHVLAAGARCPTSAKSGDLRARIERLAAKIAAAAR